MQILVQGKYNIRERLRIQKFERDLVQLGGKEGPFNGEMEFEYSFGK